MQTIAQETEGPHEDSGALLSIVLDAERCSSYLLVLDAETMQEHARARVPHSIPFGVHGEFYADPATTATTS